MALTKTVTEDKIEIVGEFKHIQVRTATIVSENGVEISRTYARHALAPRSKDSGTWADTDISGESSEVQALCNAAWTSAVKTAYEAHADSVGSTD